MHSTPFFLKSHVATMNRLVILLGLYSFFLSGCDSTFVDPFSNDSRFFTIYGFLDEAKNLPGAGANTVRVIPITRRAEVITSPADPQATIDARVFVINLATGQEVEWRHSLRRLSDTQYGHIFSSNMPVTRNISYRIEVRRSDGTVTSAETTVPTVAAINIIQDPQPIIDPITQDIRQGILIPGVPNIWSINVSYFLGANGCFTTSPIQVPYGRFGENTEDGWRFEANISKDLDNADIPEALAENLLVCAIGLEVRVPDDQWLLPETDPDSSVNSFSSVPSNVQNGLGYFGSVGVIDNAWNTTNALRSAVAQQ